MTKKVKISFLILVWSIVAVQIYVNNWDRKKQKEQMVTAFSVVNENITGETIQGYGYLGQMELSEDMKKEMLRNLALKLGIRDGYTFSQGKGDDFTKITLMKEGEYATTLLRIVTITKGKEEQHITMQIDTTAQVEDAFTLYNETKKVFEEIGVDGRVSMEVEMEKSGNVWREEGEHFVSEVFHLADARVVDSIEEKDIFTIYGYTQLEDSYLNLNREKVNIQMVMSYDEIEDKTYIKMGLPIVNSSY